ncbi:hypothetical protein RN001_016427 [Aquatica leii]|uniref:PPM-type phosphatase domain-containing protein n=1 Tax=Aquatica leii TaxID=1421715 RepID=A0AAN7P0E6_9COLE|nr:hypothetical protein RN001_016427 [Aquatica leii]
MSLINFDFQISGKCECGDTWASNRIIARKHGAEIAIFGLLHGHETIYPVEHINLHLHKLITNNAGFWSDNDDDVIKAMDRGFEETHYVLLTEQENALKKNAKPIYFSGASVCLVIIKSNKMYVAHAGSAGVTLGVEDENTYKWKAKRLTTPHTLLDVEEMERVKNSGQKIVNIEGLPCIGQKAILDGDEYTIPYLCTRSLGDFWSYNRKIQNLVVLPQPTFSIIPFDENVRCLIFGTLEFFNSVTPQLIVEQLNMCTSSQDWINPAEYLLKQASETRRYGLFDKHLMVFTVFFTIPNQSGFRVPHNFGEANTHDKTTFENLNLKWEDCMNLCFSENDSSHKIVDRREDHTVLPMILLAKKNATNNVNKSEKVSVTTTKVFDEKKANKCKNWKQEDDTAKISKTTNSKEDLFNQAQSTIEFTEEKMKIENYKSIKEETITSSNNRKKRRTRKNNKNIRSQEAANTQIEVDSIKNDRTQLVLEQETSKQSDKKFIKKNEDKKVKEMNSQIRTEKINVILENTVEASEESFKLKPLKQYDDEDTQLYELKYKYMIPRNVQSPDTENTCSEQPNQSGKTILNNKSVRHNGISATYEKKNKVETNKIYDIVENPKNHGQSDGAMKVLTINSKEEPFKELRETTNSLESQAGTVKPNDNKIRAESKSKKRRKNKPKKKIENQTADNIADIIGLEQSNSKNDSLEQPNKELFKKTNINNKNAKENEIKSTSVENKDCKAEMDTLDDILLKFYILDCLYKTEENQKPDNQLIRFDVVTENKLFKKSNETDVENKIEGVNSEIKTDEINDIGKKSKLCEFKSNLNDEKDKGAALQQKKQPKNRKIRGNKNRLLQHKCNINKEDSKSKHKTNTCASTASAEEASNLSNLSLSDNLHLEMDLSQCQINLEIYANDEENIKTALNKRSKHINKKNCGLILKNAVDGLMQTIANLPNLQQIVFDCNDNCEPLNPNEEELFPENVTFGSEIISTVNESDVEQIKTNENGISKTAPSHVRQKIQNKRKSKPRKINLTKSFT